MNEQNAYALLVLSPPRISCHKLRTLDTYLQHVSADETARERAGGSSCHRCGIREASRPSEREGAALKETQN